MKKNEIQYSIKFKIISKLSKIIIPSSNIEKELLSNIQKDSKSNRIFMTISLYLIEFFAIIPCYLSCRFSNAEPEKQRKYILGITENRLLSTSLNYFIYKCYLIYYSNVEIRRSIGEIT